MALPTGIKPTMTIATVNSDPPFPNQHHRSLPHADSNTLMQKERKKHPENNE